jgi:uncharacterized membrane protein YhhN
MRLALTGIFLLPYLYFGAKDHVYHFVGRKVSIAEHVVHAIIGIILFGAIASAFRGRPVAFVAGLAAFLVAGAADEYIWHRGLPEHESDLHAKGHLALLIFVVVALGSMWMEDHGWRLPNLH